MSRPDRPGLSTMAVHMPTDTLDRSRNKVVLLQTDSGIHSDTNSNEGDNTRDCMVWDYIIFSTNKSLGSIWKSIYRLTSIYSNQEEMEGKFQIQNICDK